LVASLKVFGLAELAERLMRGSQSRARSTAGTSFAATMAGSAGIVDIVSRTIFEILLRAGGAPL
jgi:hypothetical protein